MKFSSLRAVIIMGKDGRKRWLEISEITFPKTANKFDFGQKGFLGMGVALCAASYVAIQCIVNPDSFYGRTVDRVVKSFP